mmetsp:Transcript_5110/g.16602  ORF Transcript_5110/g.16602 Transcript_5110/m.16602 type:complete len:292 (+) Transcript_5110:494-1369(+)
MHRQAVRVVPPRAGRLPGRLLLRKGGRRLVRRRREARLLPPAGGRPAARVRRLPPVRLFRDRGVEALRLVGGACRRGARAEARLPKGAARVRPLPIRGRGPDGDGRRLGRLVRLFAARGGARREGEGDAGEAAALGLRLLGRDAGLRTRFVQPFPLPPLGLRCDARRDVRSDGRDSLRRLAPPAQPADVRARGGAGKGAAGVVASPRRVRGVAGRARRGGRRVGRTASGNAHVRVLPAVEAVPARAGGQIGASGRRRECAAPERALTPRRRVIMGAHSEGLAREVALWRTH